MWVRLTRRLADYIDGVDVSRRSVGDLLDLPTHDAEMLVAEGWASLVESAPHRRRDVRAGAAYGSSGPQQKRRV